MDKDKVITAYLREKDVIRDFEFVYHMGFMEGVEFARKQVYGFLYGSPEKHDQDAFDYSHVYDLSYDEAKEYVGKNAPLTLGMLRNYAVMLRENNEVDSTDR